MGVGDFVHSRRVIRRRQNVSRALCIGKQFKVYLAVASLAVAPYIYFCIMHEILHVMGSTKVKQLVLKEQTERKKAKAMEHPVKKGDKLSQKELIENAEAETAMEHQQSHIHLQKKLIIDITSGTEIRLKRIIEEELGKIREMPLVSWGVDYHEMLRIALPPELNTPHVQGNVPYAGKRPSFQKVEDNQILFAFQGWLRPGRKKYTLKTWTSRLEKDKSKNVGLFVMGDEKNKGSSFLAGSTSPFSFVIRDYFFDHLKDANHTQVIQLGTMTCRKRELVCSVKPPDVVFVKFLSPFVPLAMRPSNFTKASERKRKCYWAGSLRHERAQMVEYFQHSSGCEIYVTPGYNEGHNKREYSDILADAVFGLVPMGNSPETHRLAEVLMFGGIPAMLDRDAKVAHMLSYPEPIPLVSGPTWEAVDQRMRELSDDELNQLQQLVIDWWDRHWNCSRDDMRWIIAQAYAVSNGGDLCSLFASTVG